MVKKIKQLFFGVIKIIFRKIFNFLVRFTKIDNNKIIFITFQGDYTCNPKTIANELIKQKLNYDLVWVVRELNYSHYPKEIRLVKRGTFKFFKEISTAKIVIENSTNIPYLNYSKKKGQIFIQTWHGSFGLKRSDSESVKNKRWVNKAVIGGRDNDYIISNSKFENELFSSTYWDRSKLLEIGHPRNDLLFNGNEDLNISIRAKYNIPSDVKLLLYAPTFRDDKSTDVYDIDYDLLLSSLKEKFGGKWSILLRYHNNIKSVSRNQSNKIIDVTDYDDIQELMAISDIGITDYSSWICDFVLTGKPAFIYAKDLEQYTKERGFYYGFDVTPFGVAVNNNELESLILNFDQKKYDQKTKQYLNFVGCFEDGSASKALVDIIKKTTK